MTKAKAKKAAAAAAPAVARSVVKNASLSPFKGRVVADQIRGLRVSRALDILRGSPRKAAHILGKAVNSAIANAEENHQADVDALVIRRVEVSDGITLKRVRFGARGRVCRIKKRRSHILVTLADESVNEDAAAKAEA
ncbi:MAG: 50S ribosomal protein L22 [Gammaproteobacteria bacterium]